MASLSREIENYLKALLEEQAGILEIQRSLLSEQFSCVPSQINYVLQTRFTPQNGYIVETRRGGGGYVRIIHVPIQEDDDIKNVMDAIGHELGEADAERMLGRFYREGLISKDTAHILQALFKERVMRLPENLTPSGLRAYLFQHMLANLLRLTDKS